MRRIIEGRRPNEDVLIGEADACLRQKTFENLLHGATLGRATQSLHEIFDHIWNWPIPWLWIFGAIGSVWLLVFVFGLIVANGIRKEGQNIHKP
jgi:hypothetical protein